MESENQLSTDENVLLLARMWDENDWRRFVPCLRISLLHSSLLFHRNRIKTVERRKWTKKSFLFTNKSEWQWWNRLRTLQQASLHFPIVHEWQLLFEEAIFDRFEMLSLRLLTMIEEPLSQRPSTTWRAGNWMLLSKLLEPIGGTTHRPKEREGAIRLAVWGEK